MILAEKIIDERKKNGWSQEELADKLGVSRQSVSKWEGAQSVPDLQRILEMSRIFGVSTDYLLKDDVEDRGASEGSDSDNTSRRVSLEEANTFLSENKTFASKISLGVLLCVSCPVPLLIILALREAGLLTLGENAAAGIGTVILLAMVAASLIFFIPAGIAMSKWGWLEKDVFDTEYGVEGMVKDRSSKFQSKFVSSITGGVVLILAGVMAVVIGAVAAPENNALILGLVTLLMACIATGTFMITRVGIVKDGFSKILQEEDYSVSVKTNKPLKIIAPVYWMTVTAGYLLWSFLTNNWGLTWIVWPIAGILFGALSVILRGIHED
ncbi:MAG: helix-turn-helix transcriptional regulator [Clostridiales bacterium]|nr:helix-turn-helix transcriptional regulator [Clostridiales bacterium]